jgi:hypothetical protein
MGQRGLEGHLSSPAQCGAGGITPGSRGATGQVSFPPRGGGQIECGYAPVRARPCLWAGDPDTVIIRYGVGRHPSTWRWGGAW